MYHEQRRSRRFNFQQLSGHPRGAYTGGAAATWQSVLVPSQFYGASNATTTGPERELRNAALVYSGDVGDIVGGASCLWSPTNAQWTVIQTALNSGTTDFPSSTAIGVPNCFADVPRQIVYKESISLNRSPGSTSAPAFVFLRQRTQTDPAVISIP